MNRYDLEYDPKTEGIQDSLKQLGVGITFVNSSARRMIVQIPPNALDQVKGLAGILNVSESPLTK